MKSIKWAILGLGKIAYKFADDLLQVKGSELYAVASRSEKKAKDFAKTYSAKFAYSSYEDLYQDDNIDVVYIATPHTFHKEHSIAVLNSGKAVLCEKPLAINAKEVHEMVKSARANNQFLMEALWTNFMPTISHIQEIIENNQDKKINQLNAEFCFKAEYNPASRLFNPKLGGGALLDIGIYPVYLSLKLLGKPQHITASSRLSEFGIDLSTNITFSYENGAQANLYCSLEKSTPSEALIELENIKIKLHSRFHETDKLSINNKEINFNYNTGGYSFEIEHVQDCLLKGLKESPKLPLNFSMELIEILDNIRSKIGVMY